MDLGLIPDACWSRIGLERDGVKSKSVRNV